MLFYYIFAEIYVNMKRLLLKLPPYMPSVAALLLLFYLTLVPQPLPEIEPPFLDFDKVVHIVMMMCMLLTFAFDYTRKEQQRRLSLLVIVVLVIATIALGGFIELAQGTELIHRGCDLGDFVADAIGAILGGVVSRAVVYRIVR